MLDLPTDSTGDRVERAERARRLRGRAHARSGAGGQGTRRRDRGMAWPARRRLPRSATSSSPFCTTSRATPSVCRSASPRSSASAPAARLRAFYDTWYRPDRMAIVAVGDVDPQQLEAAIRAAFEPMKARAAASAPPDRSVPLHKDLLVSVASDPEVTQSTVQLIWKRPAEEHRVVGDYRRDLVEQLFEQMLNERFAELERRPDAKFLSAGAGGESLSRSVETFALSARVPDGGLAEGLSALVDRGEARPGARLQRRGARSREAMDHRLLRARVQRARQGRKRIVRAGVRALLPFGGAGTRHRVRAPARAGRAAGHHARRSDRDGASAALRREPGRPGRVAAEAGDQAAG